MKVFSYLFAGIFIVSCLVSIASCEVVELTSSNFDTKIKEKEYTLVEFYAPWCGHCKQFEPEYTKLGEKMKDSEKIMIAKVNGDSEQSLMEKYEIQGFPTVKLFKNGEVYRSYEGQRTADAVEKWLEKKTGPVSQELKTEQEIEDFKKDRTVVVGFFKSRDSENYKQFISQADSQELEEFQFGEVVGSDELNKKYNIQNDEEFVIFRSFQPDEPAHSSDFSNMAKFVKDNAYPLVEEINAKTFQRLLEKDLPIGALFIHFNENKQSYIDMLYEVALQFKDKITIGYSDGDTYGEQLNIMGGDKNNLPGFGIMDFNKQQNYPLRDQPEITKEKLTQFIQDYLDGKIEPHYRSEEPPQTNDEAVKVVVGKTFEDWVTKNEDDVLLEFYAPWCGHCKQLEPKYKQLAEDLQNVQGLTIAKIDATENDTPISIEGFPTIYFFPKGQKEKPIQYEGDRSVEDMKRFIKENAVAAKDNLANQASEEL